MKIKCLLSFRPIRSLAVLAGLTLITFPVFSLRAGEFVIAEAVRPATSLPSIIVYEGAPPRTRDAAVTLAEYLEKICGIRPALLDGKPDSIPERAIWVGMQPVVKTLFPGTDLEFKHPEETLILAGENHLVIAGRDRWNPKHTREKGRLSMKTDMQQEYGTANAVYTFIQNQLGVRWLWPGEEDVIVHQRLAIEAGEIRYHPQIRARHGMFQKLSLGDNKEGVDELWARFQRVQLDSMSLIGGHGFGHWWETYHKTHPEFFAQYPDGKRKVSRFNPRTTKLCDSNPDVWKQWLVEVEGTLERNPTQTIFSVSPNDGFNQGHCVCKQLHCMGPSRWRKIPMELRRRCHSRWSRPLRSPGHLRQHFGTYVEEALS